MLLACINCCRDSRVVGDLSRLNAHIPSYVCNIWDQPTADHQKQTHNTASYIMSYISWRMMSFAMNNSYFIIHISKIFIIGGSVSVQCDRWIVKYVRHLPLSLLLFLYHSWIAISFCPPKWQDIMTNVGISSALTHQGLHTVDVVQCYQRPSHGPSTFPSLQSTVAYRYWVQYDTIGGYH